MTLKEYRADPCRASSLPYWKTVSVRIPPDMRVERDDAYIPDPAWRDEIYFKLMGCPRSDAPSLPRGFALASPSLYEFAGHIRLCYGMSAFSVSELEAYLTHPVYAPDLWLALRDGAKGELVATGIAELDREAEEGALEWIQVSPGYRRRGLGEYMVRELLFRMAGRAKFATVSGRLENPSNPLALYRKCGFFNPILWHVARKNA